MSESILELPNKQRFTPAEAAMYLEVSRATIYRWVEIGELDAVKLGPKLLRIPRTAILGKVLPVVG